MVLVLQHTTTHTPHTRAGWCLNLKNKTTKYRHHNTITTTHHRSPIFIITGMTLCEEQQQQQGQPPEPHVLILTLTVTLETLTKMEGPRQTLGFQLQRTE